jgi:hypothetical protein
MIRKSDLLLSPAPIPSRSPKYCLTHDRRDSQRPEYEHNREIGNLLVCVEAVKAARLWRQMECCVMSESVPSLCYYNW